LLLARSVADDLVIHISNVHDVLDLVSALAQKAAQDVNGHEAAKIADVAVIIDSKAAGIHADRVVHGRRKLFRLVRKRGVETEGQCLILAKEAASFWLLAAGQGNRHEPL